jgi:DNA replication protein DnaC
LEEPSASAKGGPVLAILGDVGVGKTALGCSALGHSYDLERRRIYYAPALVYLSRLMTGSRERQERVFQDFSTADLVVIDDLNRRGCSDWARDQIELLVDARHGAKKPMILLSNLETDPFVDDVGRPIHRRIIETGGSRPTTSRSTAASKRPALRRSRPGRSTGGWQGRSWRWPDRSTRR